MGCGLNDLSLEAKESTSSGKLESRRANSAVTAGGATTTHDSLSFQDHDGGGVLAGEDESPGSAQRFVRNGQPPGPLGADADLTTFGQSRGP